MEEEVGYKKPPKKYQFKPGVVNNPKGRPKGKSLKEYARDYLAKMSDKERVQLLNDIDPDMIWRMAEGNPDQKSEHKGNIIVEISEEIAKKRNINDSASSSSDNS